MNPPRTILITLLAAAVVRLAALDLRPMHADEAIVAEITATLRQTGNWKYHAADYHGIVLPALAAAVPFEFTEGTIRLVPALAGIGLAVFVLATTRSLPAGLLAALSPAMVYWSRFSIPEMILALLSAVWLTVVRSKDLRSWAYAGVLAGAMLATKETAVLAFFAAAAAWKISNLPPSDFRNVLKMSALAAAIALAVFTGGFRQWDQLAMMPAAIITRAAGAGHEHPAWWYFPVLRWELLAIPLAALSWKQDRFLASYSVTLALIYCAIPYKTPWCAVQFWWPVLALAGSKPKPAYALAGIFAAVTVFTSFIYPASPANPYVYAQTLPEALQIPRRIQALGGRETTVQFFSTQNLWPLPWYLRNVRQQQWRREIDFSARPAPLIVVTPELEPKLTEWLYETQPSGERELYMNAFPNPVFLRPGVEVRLYCSKRLWDASQ